MNLQASVRDVVQNCRSFGVVPAFRDLEYRAINRVLPLRIFKGMTAVLGDVEPTLFNAGDIAVRFVSRDELGAASADPAWAGEMSRAFVDRALAKGDECVGTFDGAMLTSIGWYASTPTLVAEMLQLHFDPAWTYMYKGFTLKPWRGKRLHGIGMTFALKHYTALGSRGLISYVEFNNLKSLRSIEHMGYRLFGDIYVAGSNAHGIFSSTPGCRPYRFYLRRSRQPG